MTEKELHDGIITDYRREAEIMKSVNSMTRDELIELAAQALTLRYDNKVNLDGNEHPILDEHLNFHYRGRCFELSHCNTIVSLDEAEQNSKCRGEFSDRYICWTYCYNTDTGIYDYKVIPDAWLYGATEELYKGASVNELIIDEIDKWLDKIEEDTQDKLYQHEGFVRELALGTVSKWRIIKEAERRLKVMQSTDDIEEFAAVACSSILSDKSQIKAD